jgi:hypothetical protein
MKSALASGEVICEVVHLDLEVRLAVAINVAFDDDKSGLLHELQFAGLVVEFGALDEGEFLISGDPALGVDARDIDQVELAAGSAAEILDLVTERALLIVAPQQISGLRQKRKIM